MNKFAKDRPMAPPKTRPEIGGMTPLNNDGTEWNGSEARCNKGMKSTPKDNQGNESQVPSGILEQPRIREQEAKSLAKAVSDVFARREVAAPAAITAAEDMFLRVNPETGETEAKVPASKRGEYQRLTLVGGMSGSGKTSIFYDHGNSDDVYVNADWIKRKTGGEGDTAHREASIIAKLALDFAIRNSHDVIFDSTLSNFKTADQAIKRTLSRNGVAVIYFVDVSPETAVRRAGARLEKEKRAGVSGRIVPTEAFAKSYARSLPTFLELFKRYKGRPDVDFALFNNDQEKLSHASVFKQQRGELTIFDPKAFDRLMATPYEKHGGFYERTAGLPESGCDARKEARQACQDGSGDNGVDRVFSEASARGDSTRNAG